MQHFKVPAALIMALAIGAAGCGQRGAEQGALPTSPAQPGYGAPPADPYNQTTYPNAGTPPASPSPIPLPVPTVPPATGDATPSPNPTTSPAPSPSPTPIPDDHKLRITDVKKSTSGWWLWKKAAITVQVQNPLLTRAQSGKIVVSYFLNGAIVGQPTVTGISLQPAEIKSFTFKATQRSEDSNAQVTTDGQ